MNETQKELLKNCIECLVSLRNILNSKEGIKYDPVEVAMAGKSLSHVRDALKIESIMERNSQ